MLLALALPLASLASFQPVATQSRLQRGDLWAELAPSAVIVRVPERGLRAVDGRLMPLVHPVVQTHGFAYRDSSGVHRGVARAEMADWAAREDVTLVSFSCEDESAEIVTRFGSMEIRTEYWFDAHGPYLVTGITIENTSHEVMRDILVSLESMSADPRAEGWTWPNDLLHDELAPRGLMRNCWMLDDLLPGDEGKVGFSFTFLQEDGPAAGGGVDVPLAYWTNTDWPNGLDIGLCTGISWGDYDDDGWFDLFSFQSGKLLRNDQGNTWVYIGDLRVYCNPPGARYGAAWGDYDNDGLPDIATEPRSGALSCFHLLRNLSGGVFLDVAPDPNIVDDQVCNADSETNCWGDVDDDGDIDLFIPIYPQWAFGGVGNYFYRNMGPVGPGGAYRLENYTRAGGFENPPPDSARPEGAQFVDVDSDGDLDLYSNGTLYQNGSTLGVPLVRWMTEPGSGILYHDILDEGAALGDYDMDGDWDLFIAYTHPDPGVTIFENQGDGTYFEVEPGVVESPTIGIGLGLSIEDWDGDGDLDFTTRQVFRRNLTLDTGERRYVIATHSIPDSHLSSASPGWGDWDHDGDLDCALANIGTQAKFYENTIYGPTTPLDERRFVRVKPVRDSGAVSGGLLTEFGAAVEVRILGDASGLVRRKFTSSSNGYLNQGEYPLTFALPADPAPEDDLVDLHFELVIDFPGIPSEGLRRVDRHVNPALADIHLASLVEREIVVWRSGKVSIGGVVHEPAAPECSRLTTAGGGLAVADPATGLADPVPPPTGDHWVGLDFDTRGAAHRVRVREIVLDGHLLPAVSCTGGDGNMLLWDVTTPGAPVLVSGGALSLVTRARNHRSYFLANALLKIEHRYRLIARADLVRETPFAGPHGHGELTVNGSVSFAGTGACPASEVDAATVDPGRLFLTLRFAPLHEIERYCASTANSSGNPGIVDALGVPSVLLDEFAITARDLPANQFAQVFMGLGESQTPFGDGYRCISGRLTRLLRPTLTDGSGGLVKELELAQLPQILPASTWRFQVIFHDPAGAGAGFNTTDAIRVTFCP